MPNHVQNYVYLNGINERRRAEIMEAVKNDEVGIGSIDFEKIIPMPDYIFRGDLDQAAEKLYGENNWFDWSYANWGTKWNAYESNYSRNHINFWTAWSPVPKILTKLSEMYPDVTFFYEYADEDIGNNCGQMEFVAGDLTYEYYPDGDEAVQFAEDIWNYYEA